jgi:hypothetical protein
MPVRKTRMRKTYKKTRRYGGTNNNNNNNNTASVISVNNASNELFDRRKNKLQVTIYSIVDLFTRMLDEYKSVNFDGEAMINMIRVFEDEADEIDKYYGNHEMEEILNESIGEINEALPSINNNNNNGSTVTNSSNNNRNMNFN